MSSFSAAQQQLIDAARTLYDQSGGQPVSMREIAYALGITRSAAHARKYEATRSPSWPEVKHLFLNHPGKPGSPSGSHAAHDRMRFEAAKAAMQGMLAKGFIVDCGYENVGVWAVRAADALLAELAKPQDGDQS